MKLFPASVSAFVFDAQGRILLISPNGADHWQTVSGWVEEASLEAAVLREVGEELRLADVRVLDLVDAFVYVHDGREIISTFFLVRYGSGDIRPSDDATGYAWRWVTEEEAKGLEVSCPAQPRVLEKAFSMIGGLLRHDLRPLSAKKGGSRKG